jgi:hypothetical protein
LRIRKLAGVSTGRTASPRPWTPADAAQLRERALAEFARMYQAGGIVLDSGAVVHLAIA